MKKILLFTVLISLVCVCCSAGCLSLEYDPEIDILSLESDDGRMWTTYVQITNLNSCPVSADVKYTLLDSHGNLLGETTQNIGIIQAEGYKTTQSTIRASHEVETAHINVICIFELA